MIKHIVMFKLKPEKKTEIPEFKRRLDDLGDTIKEIRLFETGKNFSSSPAAYDLVLVSEFDTKEDLEKYKVHPEHKKLIEYFIPIKESSVVVDYEF